MSVKKILVLVSGSKLAWFLCRNIGTGLLSEWGSNGLDLIWWRPNQLDFCVGVEFDLVSVLRSNWLFLRGGQRGVEIDSAGRN